MKMVKFGGSVITTKAGGKSVRKAVLQRLATEVAPEAGSLVVLHGAGSFGHTLAKKANLAAGLAEPKQWQAASQVSADVRALHLEVLRSLQAAKARPFSLPPGQVAFASGGELAGLALSPFQLAISLRFTPVSCGDVVLDEKQGVAIVSADAVALHLAPRLGVDRMVFATDVDGIFTAPPGTKGATLIEDCTPQALLAATLGGSRHADVTGGMAGKAKAIATMAEQGCEVWVVNGLKAGRVRDALRGKAPRGTRIRPSKVGG
jgi:isopentenyl phosphate kinase